MLVFVYGSLRKGEEYQNHLSGAPCLGPWTTPPTWEMWDLDSYPAITPGGDTAIVGELYSIDDDLLARLDVLEEVPTLYQRHRIETPLGPAWIYVVETPPSERTVLASGSWTARS
ncbi:MAG: gamma-glutamylcyclotransferase (GGCT)/AIG2-like uncharacterized protein YtfP [Myxococcota bacterium]